MMSPGAIDGVTVPERPLRETLEDMHADTTAQEASRILTRLSARQAYETAYHLGQSGFDRWRTDEGFLKVYRDIVTQMGLVSEALIASYYLTVLGKTSVQALRQVEGRVKELSGWRPTIMAAPQALEPARPNRILHLVKESRPYYSNGFTSRSQYNFLAERDAGLQPIVMTEPGASRVDGVSRRIEHYGGIVHHHLDVPSLDLKQLPVTDYLNLFAELAYDRIQSIRPAVIHVSSGRRGYETALVALALKRHTGLPVVYEVRSFFESNWTPSVTREEHGEVFAKRSKVEEDVMQEVDFVLTISSSMEEELVRRGVPQDKIGIIPNGVDTEVFTPIDGDPTLSEHHGIDGVTTFGYVSNMDHHRESQETLIRALREVLDRGYEMRCVLVGDGPRRPLLEALAADLGVREHTVFTGRVDHEHIRDYYGLIDIFVVPRTAERAARFVTPLKPLEAMAMRKPMITSDLPALREISGPPERGLVFDVDDASGLADILCRLSDDADLGDTLARAAYTWVTEERTWRANGDRYVDYFNRVTKVPVI